MPKLEICWLKRGGAAEVIVIFGGWAVGPRVFDHLSGAQDLCFAHGYSDLAEDLPDLASYDRLCLLAWSFGVASYAHWQVGRPDPFNRKVAVNGSLDPVSRETGISPVAMKKTIEAVSAESFKVFLKRAFDVPPPIGEFDVCARRAELVSVMERGAAPEISFDRIWISSRDRIFPPANLERAWKGRPTKLIDAPHAPFAEFQCWDELLM